VGVDHGQCRVFGSGTSSSAISGGVLENVGVVACMEGVAVGKHPIVPSRKNAKWRKRLILHIIRLCSASGSAAGLLLETNGH
jgi:hypothetical protein